MLNRHLNQHLDKGDRVEISDRQQKETQKKLKGVIKPQSGHKVWEINVETKEIKEAEYKTNCVDFNNAAKNDFSINRELVINEGCVYIPALNKKNAFKKFNKSSDQDAYYFKKPSLNIEDFIR